MSIFDRLKTQKLLSFTMILFTLSLGIVIGTMVSSGVKAARSDNAAAPDATPLTIPNPVQLGTTFTQIAKMAGPSVVNISTEYAPKPVRAQASPRRAARPHLPMTIRAAAERTTFSIVSLAAIRSAEEVRWIPNPPKLSAQAWWWTAPAISLPITTWWIRLRDPREVPERSHRVSGSSDWRR